MKGCATPTRSMKLLDMLRLTLIVALFALSGCATSRVELERDYQTCLQETMAPERDSDGRYILRKTEDGVLVPKESTDFAACAVEMQTWMDAEDRHERMLERRKTYQCPEGRVLICESRGIGSRCTGMPTDHKGCRCGCFNRDALRSILNGGFGYSG